MRKFASRCTTFRVTHMTPRTCTFIKHDGIKGSGPLLGGHGYFVRRNTMENLHTNDNASFCRNINNSCDLC